jgi:GDP-mannose 6-dehydrogenase
MKITIFGLGYVGTVSAACLAEMGHIVFGMDINMVKVGLINSGHSPIVEEKIDEVIEGMVSEGRLKATTDIQEAIVDANIVLICVGTPNEDDGSLSMQAIKMTCQQIGETMHLMADYPVIVLRSTVMPGTTEEVLIPLLESISCKKAGVDFGVCFNPEFLREGSSIYDFYNPPQTIIGTDDVRSYETVASLYQNLSAPLVRTEIKVAEMIKMVCNAYHALKITFSNEIGNICKQYHIDSHHVMDIFINDKKLNVSAAYLKPGFAFGGSCLPKDVKGLLYMGRRSNLELPLLQAILPSNEGQIQTALNMVMRTKKKKIGFLGLSFKPGTDDLRSSAQVELVERLIGKGYQINIFDQYVSLARLMGANKSYIEKEIPHLSTLLCGSIEELLMMSEVIVVANGDKAFSNIFQQLKPDHIIIDLVRIFDVLPNLDGHYQGIGW